jgi:osmotically inducible protein OsmC
MPVRTADAEWRGTFREGQGIMRLESGAYEGHYSTSGRFETETPTSNPDELIAAAFAGCFSMELSGQLGKAGYTPEYIETSAYVHVGRMGEGYGISKIELRTFGRVPTIDMATFQRLAETAKTSCPVGAALASVPEITLVACLDETGEKAA